MASKSERLITEALGHPDSNNATNISFTTATASGVLKSNATYRVIATEDCYVKIEEDNAAADSDDMLMIGGLPEVFTTTANAFVLNVIRKDTDGVLQLVEMLTRGK